jgi:hypothetical protein
MHVNRRVSLRLTSLDSEILSLPTFELESSSAPSPGKSRKRTLAVSGLHRSGFRGGLNGSTQHLLEAHAQGFQELRIVRQR